MHAGWATEEPDLGSTLDFECKELRDAELEVVSITNATVELQVSQQRVHMLCKALMKVAAPTSFHIVSAEFFSEACSS